MTAITIDGASYEFGDLPKDAQVQLANLQYVDQELARLQAQTAALQTARIAYANALKAALPPRS